VVSDRKKLERRGERGYCLLGTAYEKKKVPIPYVSGQSGRFSSVLEPPLLRSPASRGGHSTREGRSSLWGKSCPEVVFLKRPDPSFKRGRLNNAPPGGKKSNVFSKKRGGGEIFSFRKERGKVGLHHGNS